MKYNIITTKNNIIQESRFKTSVLFLTKASRETEAAVLHSNINFDFSPLLWIWNFANYI